MNRLLEFPNLLKVSSLFRSFPSSCQRTACRAVLLGTLIAFLCCEGFAQDGLPFAVSNAHGKKWSAEEANRIYLSACTMVARRVRPEKPPQLRPRFVLVLGTKESETVRIGAVSEIHLQSWDAAQFAEAVAIMATREILGRDELSSIARDALLSANATISVNELQRER